MMLCRRSKAVDFALAGGMRCNIIVYNDEAMWANLCMGDFFVWADLCVGEFIGAWQEGLRFAHYIGVLMGVKN